MRNLEKLALMAALLIPRTVFAREIHPEERLRIGLYEELCEPARLPLSCRLDPQWNSTVSITLTRSDDGRYYGVWRAKVGKTGVSYDVVLEVSGELTEGKTHLTNKKYKVAVSAEGGRDPIGEFERTGEFTHLDWRAPSIEFENGLTSTLEISLRDPGTGGGDNPYPGTSGSTRH